MTTKVIAIAVIAVVVIAAVAIIMMPKGSEERQINVDSPLLVRGNADQNYVIDKYDMEIIDDIIAGDKDLKDYPMADIDGDKKVTATDKKILQDMIDRKEGTTVYIQALDRKGVETTVQVKYPLRNVVTYATNIEMATVYAGGGEYFAGYFTKSYPEAEKSVASTAVNLEGTSRSISDKSWANFTKLDADLHAKGSSVGALLVDYSGIAQITDLRQADLDASGIPTIIYKPADALSETSAVVTLSYLFGEKTEKVGQEYAKIWDKTLKTIKDKVGDIKDEDKMTFISFNMYIYICKNDSTFNTTPASALGLPYYKVNAEFREKYAGTGSDKMKSTEALANYTDVDRLINNRSIDWQAADNINKTIVDTWEHENELGPSSLYFKGFDDKLYYVNNLLPGPAKLAYVAACLYGDKVSFDWAEDVLDDCRDIGLIPLQEVTDDDRLVPYFDYGMYQEAKKAL